MKHFLYSRSIADFLIDSDEIHIILESAFADAYGHLPGDSEYNSWKKTLPQLAKYLDCEALKDHEILLEFVPPAAGSRKRADAVLLGKTEGGKHVALIIENKRWPDSGIKSCGIDDFVLVGMDQELHPSIQAEKYASTTRSYHDAITSSDAVVKSCGFLPATKDSNHPALSANKFADDLAKSPLFVNGQQEDMQAFMLDVMPQPPNKSFVASFRKCNYRPAESLLYVAHKIFTEEAAWQLDEKQQLAFNSIINEIRNIKKNTKVAVVVRGGPGTGKSLIAMKLLGVFAAELGERVSYACGNSSFRDNLAGHLTWAVDQKMLNCEVDFASLFTSFRAFYGKDPNSYDLIICDEAQRLRPDSSTAYQPVASAQEQALEVMQASRISVFFLDENQRVRNGDIGNRKRIKQTADYLGTKYLEFNLVSQFRCCESENYIASLNQLFDLESSETFVPQRKSSFEFSVLESPFDLENALRKHLDSGKSARMLAGYCWPWTKTKKRDEELTEDVAIGDWKRPWNRSPSSSGKAYRRTHYLWATDPDCFEQVGCIHTSHGIEFDYVGVIMGGDLVYRAGVGWTCDKTKVFDRGFKHGIVEDIEEMTDLLINIYRTLLTRGRNGCYLLCLDDETRDHIAANVRT